MKPCTDRSGAPAMKPQCLPLAKLWVGGTFISSRWVPVPLFLIWKYESRKDQMNIRCRELRVWFIKNNELLSSYCCKRRETTHLGKVINSSYTRTAFQTSQFPSRHRLPWGFFLVPSITHLTTLTSGNQVSSTGAAGMSPCAFVAWP